MGLFACGSAAAQTQVVVEEPICSAELRGFVTFGEATLAEGGGAVGVLVEELSRGSSKTVHEARTDDNGEFHIRGGARRSGTIWQLRLSLPGAATTIIKMKINPRCGEPTIKLAPAV